MRPQIALVLLLAAGCSGSSSTKTAGPPAPPGGGSAEAPAPTPPIAEEPAGPAKPVANRALASTGLEPAALDRAADPCTDFYQFACGSWIAKAEIPADKPITMRSFIDINDRNLEYLHGVLEQLRKTPGTDPAGKQLGAYYGACMDEAAVEKAGIRPIAGLRASIDQIRDARSLSAAIGRLHADGFQVLFAMNSAQDAKDATQVIIDMDQGGLGLPDRDYYLNTDDKSKALRGKYQEMVAAMLVQLGAKPDAAARDAARIIELETKIAKVSLDKVKRRDPVATYNKIDKAGVKQALPGFDWDGFWKATGLAAPTGVTVSSRAFFEGLAPLLSESPDLWRAYLHVHLATQASAVLTQKLQDIRFGFFSSLTGQPEQKPRWKRCIESTDGALGDLLGQVFVRDRFAGASKTAAEEQIAAIRAAMAKNLGVLAWMDPQTKTRANQKLDAMTFQIGYPKTWRVYPFKIDPKAFGATALAARKFERTRKLAKIGKPVDRDDWQMSAPTVNAYYDPQLNGMVFPAGILQPPFYSIDASIPVNLGGMGVVVGHELTHGFDDQGAQFDAAGNLTSWWEPATEKQFKTRTKCVVDQYAKYTVAGGTKLNGENTLGENIADIGGVKLAFAAYRNLRAAAPETVVADGFTEDQQFFLGFGQAWCAKARESYEQLLATVDVHSPARWRVNGALAATPEFVRAFRCKPGAKMIPPQVCSVW